MIVLGMALGMGRNVNKLIAETLTKRFENLELIDELSQQTAIAEIARVQAEAANRSKTQFFAAASHDLRQPLHAMSLFVAALNEKVRESEAQGLLHNINASITALESFFDELLDISKIDAGVTRAELAHIPVSAVFQRVRTNFEQDAQNKGLALSIFTTRRYAYSDPILLERILSNLVSNAIRYTPSGASSSVAVAASAISFSGSVIVRSTPAFTCGAWFGGGGAGFTVTVTVSNAVASPSVAVSRST